jgi:hypothetical protein
MAIHLEADYSKKASSGIFRVIFTGQFSVRLHPEALANEIKRAGRRLLSLSSRRPAVECDSALFWPVSIANEDIKHGLAQ